MRNGNLIAILITLAEYLCPYPTYEEWKHSLKRSFLMLLTRPYPTYEEWKLVGSFKFLETKKSSYPTYEEWKHFFCVVKSPKIYFVLILPMRNGNLQKR